MIYNISEIRVGAANISSGYVGGNIVWPNAPAGNPIIAYFTDLIGNRYPAKNPDGYPNPNELSSDTLASLPTGHTWYQLDTTSACTSIGSDWAVAERVNETIAVVNLAQGLQEIHQGAFYNFQYLREITIPEGVYYVGGGAFEGCSELTSVTLPNSLRTLSDRTFVGCQNLSAVTMPNALADIGGHVFADCTSLSSITIPNTVVQIGNDVGEEFGDDGYTFVNCPLTSLTIPASVQAIAEYSFGNLRNLEWIEFKGTTPPQHGSDVFYNIEDIIQERGENIPIYVPCSALDAYKEQWSEYATLFECKEEPFEGKARLTLSDGSKVIIPGSGGLRRIEVSAYSATCVSVEIGSACTSTIGGIANGPFTDFYFLSSVTISDSVTNIGPHTFTNCSGLTSVTIGTGVQVIENDAFGKCTSLPSITIPDSVTTISGGAFNNCTSLTSLTIGTSVQVIGNSAFQNCTSLPSVTIPNSVTTIEGYSFRKCTSLTSLTIGNSVTSIGEYAFHDCSSLTSITIPDSVTTIGAYAFESCNNLTGVTIPNNVTSIGTSAFRHCSGLTSITIEATTPPTLGDGSFYNTNNCPIYVPAESVNTYKSATGYWPTWKDRIQPIP